MFEFRAGISPGSLLALQMPAFPTAKLSCQLARRMREQIMETAPYPDKSSAAIQPNAFYCTREFFSLQ
jgi:hypothetical protein